MEKKLARKQYSKFAKKWYRKFVKFEKKRSNKDIAYNQDTAILLSILYTVLYYRNNHLGYPGWIDPDGTRTALDNCKIWDETLDKLISNLIYLVDHDQWDDEYRTKYITVMNKLKELLPSL